MVDLTSDYKQPLLTPMRATNQLKRVRIPCWQSVNLSNRTTFAHLVKRYDYVSEMKFDLQKSSKSFSSVTDVLSFRI